MITINNLVKYYDKYKALDINHLTIKENKIYAFVGENGCGKSTLLRCITGIFNYSGEILIDNINTKNDKSILKDVFFICDNPLYNVSIKDLYNLYKTFYDFNKEDLLYYLNQFELSFDASLKKLSKGIRRRAYLAFALTIKPKYLILDEAFDGVDIKAKNLFKELLFKILETKEMTVIISTHALREVDLLCDEYYLLNKGKIISSSSSDLPKQYIKYTIVLNEKQEIKHRDIINIIGLDRIITIYAHNTDELKLYIDSLKPHMIETYDLTIEEAVLYIGEDQHA